MTKLIPTDERILKARKLIEKARALPRPETRGWEELAYTADVKEILRQANDLLKFIPLTSGPTVEQKAEAVQIMKEIVAAEKEILHPEA
jgi:hypothetical protein